MPIWLPSFLRPRTLSFDEQRALMLDLLTPYATGEGFVDSISRTDYPIEFRKEVPGGMLSFYIVVKHVWHHDFSRMQVYHKQVEDVLSIVGLAHTYPSGQKTCTISDPQKLLGYDVHKKPASTLRLTEQFIDAVIDYVKKHGLPFADRYMNLQHVVTEMDRIESQGDIWFKFVSGGPDSFARSLTISKLANDAGYDRRVKRIFDRFQKEHGNEDWFMRLEKTVEVLKQF